MFGGLIDVQPNFGMYGFGGISAGFHLGGSVFNYNHNSVRHGMFNSFASAADMDLSLNRNSKTQCACAHFPKCD